MTGTIDLGGPLSGPRGECSRSRVRRLLAGELTGEERASASAHLLACERCRAAEREAKDEADALHSALPFEAFASGVAERLAKEPARRSRLATVARWAPLAAAACFLFVIVALPSAVRRDDRDGGLRSKGGVAVTLHVRDPRGLHVFAAGEAVPESSDLYVSLRPEGKKFAAMALLEGSEVHLLYGGLAHQGRLGEGFGWTGAHGALLVVVLDDAPVDGVALVQRLRGEVGQIVSRAQEAARPQGSRTAVVLTIPLQREAR